MAREEIWRGARLDAEGPLVDRLSGLAAREEDLKLIREVVSPQERKSVGRLESPRTAISLLAAKIFAARTRTGGPDFAGSEAQRQAELRHLDELSRELAELATRG